MDRLEEITILESEPDLTGLELDDRMAQAVKRVREEQPKEAGKLYFGDRLARVEACLAACEGFEDWPGMVWEMQRALRRIVYRHAELVSSGDCGFWDVEEEPQVKEARALLARLDAKEAEDE